MSLEPRAPHPSPACTHWPHVRGEEFQVFAQRWDRLVPAQGELRALPILLRLSGHGFAEGSEESLRD